MLIPRNCRHQGHSVPVLHHQWQRLRQYANDQRRAAFWRYADLHCARQRRRMGAPRRCSASIKTAGPIAVAGVPPDYFSAKMASFGATRYTTWDVHARSNGYGWWAGSPESSVSRPFRYSSNRSFSRIRVVLVGTGRVRDTAKHMVHGNPVLATPYFDAMQNALGNLPIVAERSRASSRLKSRHSGNVTRYRA